MKKYYHYFTSQFINKKVDINFIRALQLCAAASIIKHKLSIFPMYFSTSPVITVQRYNGSNLTMTRGVSFPYFFLKKEE